jgi:ATP-dependent helicase/nuclease subunit A
LTDDLKPPADQRERAQTLDTQQSFLVQAPAGSGKTELLTRRLLKLLAEVDEPEEILAITFTIAATAEMRARVLKALHGAENPASSDQDLEVAGLASAALANDKARGWNLLQQPQRLSILTIDAVCLTIAHETPLLSRLGGSLSPTDNRSRSTPSQRGEHWPGSAMTPNCRMPCAPCCSCVQPACLTART